MFEQVDGMVAIPKEPTVYWSKPFAISEDGNTLALALEEKSEFYLYIANLKNGTLTRICNLDVEESNKKQVMHGQLGDLTMGMSADGNKIAFTSAGKDGFLDVFVADLEEKTLTNISNEEGSDEFQPSLSPDGAKVAYISKKRGSEGIYVADLNKKTVTRATNSYFDSYPKIVQTKLLYTSEEIGDFEIYLLDLKTGSVENLTMNEANDWEAAISNDGRMLAFTSNRVENQLDIYTMDLVTRELTNVTPTLNSNEYDPSLSADGKHLLFTREFDGQRDIYKLNLKSGELILVSNHSADDCCGIISGDASTTTFSSNRWGIGYKTYIKK